MRYTKILNRIATISLCVLLVILTCTSSSDFSQDLGRHLTLGNIILRTHTVPDTNLFSYTNPTYPFINHHWLSEVLFYAMFALAGVKALIVLKSLAIITALALVFTSASAESPVAAVFSMLLTAPLLLERSDVRPEFFGYLFFSLMIYIASKYRSDKKLLWGLPLILLFWVNMHITFVFGVLLFILIYLQLLYDTYSRHRIYSWKVLFLLPVAFATAVLLNPHGLYGALYPLFILGHYGYTIVENQSIFFLLQNTHNILISYFLLLLPLSAVSVFTLLYLRRYMYAALLTIFCALTLWQIRQLPFFIFAAVPAFTLTIAHYARFIPKNKQLRLIVPLALTGLITVLCIYFSSGMFSMTFDRQIYFGLTVNEDGKKAAEFMLTHHLPANIFNNFDIGGYAIYRLYPQYRVFVDNRPEAYPEKFLQQLYIPMQYSPELTEQVFRKYNIHTVFFAHTDQTPWGVSFLTSIINNKRWKMVYLDSTMVILSSDTTLPDVRNDDAYVERLVHDENNYLKLLQLTNMVSLLNKRALSNEILSKAYALNPNSCVIQNYLYTTSGNALQHEEIKQNTWYCF